MYSFGFNGKLHDDDIYGKDNSYDYGARFYDPRLGKFMSIDPLVKRFPWLSPYIYAADNPIRYTDVDGKGPGDKFKSPDEAAHDFAKTYNDNSIADKKEYASSIIKVTNSKEVYYTYVQPSVGSEAGSTPSTRGLAGQETVADVHTHGNYSPKYDNNHFSPQDIKSNNEAGYPGYVATPSGSLQKYDPGTKKTTTIATDIPSDPNDPDRINTVDPGPLPKNEPTYGVWDFIKHNVLVPLGEGAGAIKGKAPAQQQNTGTTGGGEGKSTGTTGTKAGTSTTTDAGGSGK